jgi:DNA invertase Pin-like site-specific DNA recombinase
MTMRRSLIPLLLLALLCAAPAAAQDAGSSADRPSGGGGAPTELWDEFPLKQPPPESAGGGAPRRGGEASAGGDRSDDGSASALQLLLAVGAGLALLALAGAGISRRRSRVRVAAAAEPAAAPAGPAPSPQPAATAPAGPAPPPAVAGTSAAGRAPVPVSEPVVAPAAAAASARLGGPGQATTSIGGGAAATPGAGNGAPAAAPRAASGSPAHTERALGYTSVSDSDGKGAEDLKEQVRAIQEACQRRGLTLVKVVRDVESHVSSDLRRPGLTFALDRLAAREASCLVITSLERLTRTAAHLITMLGWIEECKARLVVLDLDLDTGTHEGKLGARALATVGGLERKKVEERTRKGLEAARNLRRSGRPAVSDRPSLKRRISEMRAQGMTLQAIADTLNAEGVPTLRGGAEWRPSSVQAAAGYKRPNRKDRPRVRHGESREKAG